MNDQKTIEKVTEILNEARCNSPRIIGNRELAIRVCQALGVIKREKSKS